MNWSGRSGSRRRAGGGVPSCDSNGRYLPYTIQLHDFRNDTFTGSRVARNFSSDLRVVPADGSPREAFIRMNQPLRYEGLTFYQSGFYQGPLNRNTGTVLQVAGNPGSWIPYLSCVIVTVGLCWQLAPRWSGIPDAPRPGGRAEYA